MLSEGVLLVVAAQAGFIDGPRVLANMAVDSWVPRRFAALSDRLTTHNGIVLMGATSLAALLYAKGDVGTLVVMYSINVFLTFSLSMFGMLRHTWQGRRQAKHWHRKALLFTVGFLLCATILVITVMEKFKEGGWITLLCTGAVIGLCFVIRGHYRRVRLKLAQLYQDVKHLGDLAATWPRSRSPSGTRRRPSCWSRASAASASIRFSTCSAPFPRTSRTWSSSPSA